MEKVVKAIEPGEKRRRILRWLYFPWTWLVFIPYLAVSTIIFGTLAFLTAMVSKRLGFHWGTVWAWLLCRMNWTWVSVKGRKNIKKGQSYIIMSNHQSHFDILAIYGHWWKQFRWVMKQELRKVPGLGYGCAKIGHIFIDRSDREKAIASLKAARPLLEGGISVMFFPEGTRSRDGRMLPFKKGGFMMALDLDLPILPVTIRGSRHVLIGKKLKLLPGYIRIQIHEPIEVSPYGHEKRDELMKDVRAVIASGISAWERGEDPRGEK
jgi:1-acyl-sn-glycerol-3-phosphate acyltransferase